VCTQKLPQAPKAKKASPAGKKRPGSSGEFVISDPGEPKKKAKSSSSSSCTEKENFDDTGAMESPTKSEDNSDFE
jgi:hypothetical protein